MFAVGWLLIINIVFDYLLIHFIEQLFHNQIIWWRKWLAIVGSASIATILVDTISGGIISFLFAICIAFSTTWDMFIRQSVVLFLSSCLLGGILTFLTSLFYIASYLPLVILFSLLLLRGLYKIWQSQKKGQIEQHYSCDVTIQLFDMKFHVKGFYDSGNSCYEPLSGQPVHFLALDALPMEKAAPLIAALKKWDAKHPANISMFPLNMRTYLRIIRLQTVQQEVLALAIRLPHISINSHSYSGHYIVVVKDAQHFPQQAELIVHCSAKL